MSLTLNILVFILDPPNITLQDKNYIRREKSVSLDYKVDGYPIPTIPWTPCKAQENVCDQSTLNISKVQDDGVYTCTANNRLGNDIANTSLGKSFYFMCTSFLRTKCFCHWWENYSITFSKYCESTRLVFFMTKFYHQWRDRRIVNCN